MMSRIDSRTEQVDVRGLRYNVRHWGPAGAPELFLLHGWMDASATFQFVVDAFRQTWHVIAPDWRGYGGSDWLSRPYWFPDYYADLDCLLAHYSPDRPVRLVGHSMGASIASVYAGVRPWRVDRLAMLDFLGLKPSAGDDSPTLIGEWLAAMGTEPKMRGYPSHAALARRLQSVNPRLGAERAAFLAQAVSRIGDDGRVEMACDPWHKIPAPAVYRVEDAMASWRRIVAPVLLLIAEDGFVRQRFGSDSEELRRRMACFATLQSSTIADAGHNLQHDQPEVVAAALEAFLLGE